MPDFKVLYPGRFMAKEALAAPKTIRITKITATVLEGEKGDENKVVVSYKAADGEGEIVWNKTNALLTAFALGTRDYDQWIGKLLTIYNNPNIDLAGKKVGGIRVFGSPEMKEPLTVEVKRPRRKKGEMYKLVPTDSKGAPRTSSNTPRAAEKPSAPPDVADELPPPEYLERVEAEVA
jgi:hypothetical protein